MAARQSQHEEQIASVGVQGHEEFNAAVARERGKSEEQLLVLEQKQAESLAANQSQRGEQIAHMSAQGRQELGTVLAHECGTA